MKPATGQTDRSGSGKVGENSLQDVFLQGVEEECCRPDSTHSGTSIGLPLSFGPSPRRNGTAFSAHAAGSG
jgi:hypothetical protein